MYNFKQNEKKWQSFWQNKKIFNVVEDARKPKFYILDMFPYPSGAGLHVGHPLGYIASDIYTRIKRLQGFNVLHPMGYDAFGLPAEQYAIQTGQHPAITTEQNVQRYRQQLDQIGLSFDWDRQVRTCDPEYYHWTQWIFMQLFEHWYDHAQQKARPIAQLLEIFQREGNHHVQAAQDTHTPTFSAQEWQRFSESQQQQQLLHYRLAYLAETMVNWCSALGTVLANDEVREGVSVRGGHPVEQKKMQQWCLRMTAYVERLLTGLDELQWSESLKEMQRNWIGRSTGAQVSFALETEAETSVTTTLQTTLNTSLKTTLNNSLEIFTTRPDTIFGCTFMVLAPEHDLVEKITTPEQAAAVADYLAATKKKSERDRIAQTKEVSGVFTGGYCLHPFTGKKIPIWISDYVLAGYGTGAVMAVPGHDSRDHAFARKFQLPIVQVVRAVEVGDADGREMGKVDTVDTVSTFDIQEQAFEAKDGIVFHSEFLDGLSVPAAISKAIQELQKRKVGEEKINYKLRDAIFSRQRYWGEPFPVYYKDGLPYLLPENQLPLKLPAVDKYLPTASGEPPLARAQNWKTSQGFPLELSTMPGFAGSSAYFLRYMDPHNPKMLVDPAKNRYWGNVDLYVGGSEHATGHLLYARFWNMFLFDLGVACMAEPFQKLVNQGMIQGRSQFVYQIKGKNTFVSYNLRRDHPTFPIHVDVSLVDNDVLDVAGFKNWRPEYSGSEFILEDGKYICGHAVEKMSKSLYNVVNPDTIVEKYGADALRLFEMFLGPIEQSKPWNTSGIEGVHRFLNKFWRLFYAEKSQGEVWVEEWVVQEDAPSEEELKILHKTIKKVQDDMEVLSFNTSVAAFMICVNDLGKLGHPKRSILEPLVILLSPFAPHMCEELWEALGHRGGQGLADAHWPTLIEKYLVAETHSYPVSINGKMKFVLELPLDLSVDEIRERVLQEEQMQKLLGGKEIKKSIIVPKKVINFVI